MTEPAPERALEPSIRISGGAGPFEAAAIAIGAWLAFGVAMMTA